MSSTASQLTIRKSNAYELDQLYSTLQKSHAQLVSPDGTSRDLPESLHAFLAELIDAAAKGTSLSIIQHHTNFTTAEAAKLLGSSRQFLVNLLERGDIPFHRVGTHRRIYARDLLRYKAARDSNRREALRDLVKAEVEEGLYDRTLPSDVEPG